MEYRYLGRTGMRVSELCFGAMSFGRESDEQTSHAMLDRFVEVGGNFIDTANVYTNGTSEQLVGELVGTDPQRFVIATKYTSTMRPDAGGTSRMTDSAVTDLPHPLSPTTPSVSPRSSVSDTPSTALTMPSRV